MLTKWASSDVEREPYTVKWRKEQSCVNLQEGQRKIDFAMSLATDNWAGGKEEQMRAYSKQLYLYENPVMGLVW